MVVFIFPLHSEKVFTDKTYYHSPHMYLLLLYFKKMFEQKLYALVQKHNLIGGFSRIHFVFFYPETLFQDLILCGWYIGTTILEKSRYLSANPCSATPFQHDYNINTHCRENVKFHICFVQYCWLSLKHCITVCYN